MQMWRKIKIGDLGRIVTGKTPPTERTECFGSKYPFITPSDMDGRKITDGTERYLSDEGANLLRSMMLPSRSVCVSCIGWQMGKVTMTSESSFTNQQLNSIVTNELSDPDFLYYALSIRREELKRLGSVGTRTPILNKSRFQELEVAVPLLELQRKIGEILSTYDNLIGNNR